MKKGIIILLLIIILSSYVLATQCSDKIDNDGDGCADVSGGDLGCSDATDDDESDGGCAQCADTIDNDGDGFIDFSPVGGGDLECDSLTDNSEGCYDSDGGINYILQGTTDNGVDDSTDSCSGENVIEYYCSGLDVVSTFQSCDIELGVGGYGATCSGGECIEYCEETDGGLDYFTAGTATKGSTSNADICGDGMSAPLGSLKEQYCNAGELDTVVYNCLPGECIDGACTNPSPQCDNGIDDDGDGCIDVAGGDLGCADAEDDDESDLGCSQCADTIDNDGDTFIDFVPIGGGDLECRELTDNSEACDDSDLGQDFLVLGTAYNDVISEDDACEGDNVREYYCSGDDVLNVLGVCDDELGVGGLGASCAGGICVEKCEDSDFGKDYELQGTIAKGVETYTDECCMNPIICPGAPVVREYFCEGDEISSELHPCPGCDTGACPVTQCNDGIDNDGDGCTDGGDLGCDDLGDDDESDGVCAECSDGIDNDGDGCTDWEGGDLGCADARNGIEDSGICSECSNGIDDDVNGCEDEADSGCDDLMDNDESGGECAPQCSDEEDNDGDGYIDLDDCGCDDIVDVDESGCPVPLVGCEVDNMDGYIIWSDGYEEIGTAYKDVPVYLVLVANDGQDCNGVTATFKIPGVEEGEGDIFTVPFEEEDGSWYAVGEWRPGETGEDYTFTALLSRDVEERETDESNGIDIEDCPLEDPEDCVDIWFIEGGGEDDIPPSFEACLDGSIESACGSMPWSECQRNDLTGNYEQTRTLRACEGGEVPEDGCCLMDLEQLGCEIEESSPAFYGEALQRKPCDHEEVEGFPMFDWVNALVIMIMLISYYVIKKR